MSWWGKLAGGGLGFALGGPLGALIGTILGHQLDKPNDQQRRVGFDPGSQERTQAAFFTATFAVMGHIAKADGRVSAEEIQLAQHVMQQMRLTEQQQQTAKQLFRQGKQADFDLDEVLLQFKQECRRKVTLIQMFIEIQLQAVYADGKKDPTEEKILKHICDVLGYPKAFLTQLESMIFARQQRYQSTGAGRPHVTSRESISNAYKILGVSRSASETELKKAYRRLMSQHHPDKLIAKGLPEEMIDVATEKTQEIQKAYELIKESRKKSK